ncbi:carbohydrate ABC transporter substrate-binding protein [Ruminiclostridium herbifermentans]|uniref:Carbohydrate ABC transporter substrate-binding protein n=1 Tax=Ruminiclostridium herbifermentans TaxID=2488810 RepID=A0A7H1VPN3_9FIRM|nr:ABC transporter substrate-binding protein [Ruminiclostridium herbifermentans]QNU67345.1 carbohydrate ABC transporter substrate-binding protein [Ruminiclostridium herbifermentans]
MLKKWVSLILIVIMSVTILGTGCSDDKASKNDKVETTENASNTSENDEKILNVCYFSPLYDYYSLIFQNYGRIHSDIKLKEKVLTVDGFDSFQETFQAELAAGKGADIISLPIWGLPNNYKLMQDEVLCDLNPLISNDIELKLQNYNEIVMNSGVYNGKRYFIPVDYCFSYFYTYDAVLGDYKIDSTKWTWDDIVKVAREYSENEKSICKYFFDSKFNFFDLKYSDKASYVDYNNKTSSFNSERFIKLLQTYKELLPYVCPFEEENQVLSNEDRLKLSLLHSENYTGIVKNTTGYVKVFDQDPVYVPYPTYDGDNSVNAFATNIVAITSKCELKEEAFDFIKIMLSKTLQDDEVLNAPVMNSVFEEHGNIFKSRTKSKNSIVDIFEKVNSCTLGDGSVDEIIKAELPDFVSGVKTAEQTAQAIDEKVKALLNE